MTGILEHTLKLGGFFFLFQRLKILVYFSGCTSKLFPNSFQAILVDIVSEIMGTISGGCFFPHAAQYILDSAYLSKVVQL